MVQSSNDNDKSKIHYVTLLTVVQMPCHQIIDMHEWIIKPWTNGLFSMILFDVSFLTILVKCPLMVSIHPFDYLQDGLSFTSPFDSPFFKEHCSQWPLLRGTLHEQCDAPSFVPLFLLHFIPLPCIDLHVYNPNPQKKILKQNLKSPYRKIALG